jgi:hypothetical protein
LIGLIQKTIQEKSIIFIRKYIVVAFQSNFIQKFIKIIFFIFKKLFLMSAHQNDLKTPKKY